MNPLIDLVIPAWTDKNGLVKPQKSWQDSGNGLLYSSMLVLLTDLKGDAYRLVPWIRSKIKACTYSPGCLKRNPEGSFGQESWDDYLGVAAACIVIKDTAIPRSILLHGFLHFGFFINDKTFDFTQRRWFFPWLKKFSKGFLLLYVHVWAIMLPAAFPWFKWFFFPLIWAVSKTMEPNLNDPGGIQTMWMYLYAAQKIGFHFDKYDQTKAMLPDALKKYYDLSHPFCSAV